MRVWLQKNTAGSIKSFTLIINARGAEAERILPPVIMSGFFGNTGMCDGVKKVSQGRRFLAISHKQEVCDHNYFKLQLFALWFCA